MLLTRAVEGIRFTHPYITLLSGWSVVGIPIVEKPTLYGSVAQMVSALACHARGRGFETHRSRQYGPLVQLGERIPCKDEVIGSTPIWSTRAGNGMGGNEQIVLTECTIGDAV